jgi:hypothetical protein
MNDDFIINTTGDLVYDGTDITISSNNGISYSYDTIDLNLDYVDKEVFKDYLKNNPDLFNDIIKDLRKEKINKIINK